jgi:hypothetical protein
MSSFQFSRSPSFPVKILTLILYILWVWEFSLRCNSATQDEILGRIFSNLISAVIGDKGLFQGRQISGQDLYFWAVSLSFSTVSSDTRSSQPILLYSLSVKNVQRYYIVHDHLHPYLWQVFDWKQPVLIFCVSLLPHCELSHLRWNVTWAHPNTLPVNFLYNFSKIFFLCDCLSKCRKCVLFIIESLELKIMLKT